MRFFFLFSFLILAIFSRLDRHFFKQNGSFCPKFILPHWTHCPQFQTPSVEIDAIIDQPFRYLTKGKQSFVFISQDGRWVLKCMRLPRYARHFSKKGRSSSLVFLAKTFESAKWAQMELSDETQVVYAHLQPTSHLKKQVILIDHFEREHDLQLDELPFVLQRFGGDFFAAFDQAKDKKELINQTIALFSSCYEKGFIDRDPILDKNFGMLEGHPFIMDIGQLEKAGTLPSKREYLELMTISLRGKLERESPELYTYYKKILN